MADVTFGICVPILTHGGCNFGDLRSYIIYTPLVRGLKPLAPHIVVPTPLVRGLKPLALHKIVVPDACGKPFVGGFRNVLLESFSPSSFLYPVADMPVHFTNWRNNYIQDCDGCGERERYSAGISQTTYWWHQISDTEVLCLCGVCKRDVNQKCHEARCIYIYMIYIYIYIYLYIILSLSRGLHIYIYIYIYIYTWAGRGLLSVLRGEAGLPYDPRRSQVERVGPEKDE